MNKKLGALLFTAALATGCDSQGQGNLVQVSNDISRKVVDTMQETPNDGSLANYFDFDTTSYSNNGDTITENSDINKKCCKYDELIKKTEAPIVSGDVTKPEISITIDDGCGAKYTEQILDTLAKYNVKVTFFIPGTRIKMHAEQRRRAIKEGHQVCCHSFDHHYFKTSEPALLKKQILDWEAAVEENLGEEYLNIMKMNFPFFRFPGGWGATNPEHLAVLKELGYEPFGRSDCTWENDKTLHNGEIELFHVKPADFSRISNCIQQAQAQGLQCKPLTEIVDPENGYEEPITGKNLRKKRREAQKINEELKN